MVHCLKMKFLVLVLLVATGLPVVAARTEASEGRTHGGFYSADRLANARRNVGRYAWARDLCSEAVARAEPWVRKSDDELWAMVPGQDLPRTIDVTLTRSPAGATRTGCLTCGSKIDHFGAYPYEPDFEKLPWKLTCPSCGSVFPTNDFGAYYRSGVDERGLFNPARADRSLLFNTAHPDPKDPLHRFGVDDGFGFVDAKGHAHRFMGYYAWKYWRWIQDGLVALADAFVLSGDSLYAHKAAILLDRIADVYPEMDWKPYADKGWYHSDGNRGVGRIEGAIWETNVARKLAQSYDAILSGTLGDDAMWTFLEQKSRSFRLPTPKGSRADFVRGVDERLLRTIYRSVLARQIEGNEGMHQLAVAMSALALNSRPESIQWLQWLNAPGGGAIPGLIVSQLDRDGATDEAAPNYAVFAGQMFNRIAAILRNNPFGVDADYSLRYPQLRANFSYGSRLAVLGKAVPNLGDTGATGLVTLAPGDPKYCALGFRIADDPELAIAAYRLNHYSGEGLGRDVLDAEPDAFELEIERLGSAAGPRRVGGHVMTGYGLAVLETGRTPEDGFAIALNYGRTTRHGHADVLNFDLFGFGRWLAPDFGYPEFATAWPATREWTVNTLAHNTVMVDREMQTRVWGGKVRLFRQLEGFGIVEIDGRIAYPQAEEYRRTIALVETPDRIGAYAIDIFHVKGGNDHILSFHGPPGKMASIGLNLNRQNGGTYAGVEVPYARSPGNFPVGTSYLYDVQRDAHPDSAFIVDWEVEPGYRGLGKGASLHVRLHGMSANNDVALAWGDPPQNKAGNPRRVGFLLQHRGTSDGTRAPLESTFVSVIEPYPVTPSVLRVERLPVAEGGVAIQVTLTDGHRDLFCWNATTGSPGLEAAGIRLTGRCGWMRIGPDGTGTRAILIDGENLEGEGVRLQGTAEIRGTVVKMSRELGGGGWVLVRADTPLDERVLGQTMHITNDNERDACYVIKRYQPEGDLWRVSFGDISFVRGFEGPTLHLRDVIVPASYDRGFRYDFEPGAPFTIPLHAEWRRASAIGGEDGTRQGAAGTAVDSGAK